MVQSFSLTGVYILVKSKHGEFSGMRACKGPIILFSNLLFANKTDTSIHTQLCIYMYTCIHVQLLSSCAYTGIPVCMSIPTAACAATGTGATIC